MSSLRAAGRGPGRGSPAAGGAPGLSWARRFVPGAPPSSPPPRGETAVPPPDLALPPPPPSPVAARLAGAGLGGACPPVPSAALGLGLPALRHSWPGGTRGGGRAPRFGTRSAGEAGGVGVCGALPSSA